MKLELKRLAREVITVFLLVMTLLLVASAYAQTWPPFLVVESSSMQHGDDASIGAIDTGDMVLLQANAKIVTYVEGRANGYSSYGDYGDVIVFLHPLAPWFTPIIHRAIVFVQSNGTAYDVPSLGLFNVTQVRIDRMGWNHDLNITFWLDTLEQRAGYLTMGDKNAYTSYGYDKWIVPTNFVLGRARGELPGLGLIKLFVSGTGQEPTSGAWIHLAVVSAVAIGIPITIGVFRRKPHGSDVESEEQ